MLLRVQFCILLPLAASVLSAAEFPAPSVDIPAPSAKQAATAVFAGGCFWGVEGVFEQLKGVSNVVSGYAGGSKLTAHYEVVGMGMTGHAESVKVTYDPSQISYGQLLEVFFSVTHDPTQLNRQGPDSGTQYRSVVFFNSDDQKRVVQAYVQQLDAAKLFPKKIVTQVVPLNGFYPAEEEHQHFLERNPDNPYIVYNDLPKLGRLKKQFPELLKHR
jgi:peptide-methionine (S)-S-oxide reductase